MKGLNKRFVGSVLPSNVMSRLRAAQLEVEPVAHNKRVYTPFDNPQLIEDSNRQRLRSVPIEVVCEAHGGQVAGGTVLACHYPSRNPSTE